MHLQQSPVTRNGVAVAVEDAEAATGVDAEAQHGRVFILLQAHRKGPTQRRAQGTGRRLPPAHRRRPAQNQIHPSLMRRRGRGRQREQEIHHGTRPWLGPLGEKRGPVRRPMPHRAVLRWLYFLPPGRGVERRAAGRDSQRYIVLQALTCVMIYLCACRVATFDGCVRDKNTTSSASGQCGPHCHPRARLLVSGGCGGEARALRAGPRP